MGAARAAYRFEIKETTIVDKPTIDSKSYLRIIVGGLLVLVALVVLIGTVSYYVRWS